MAKRPIKIKINVSKILKEHMFKGQKGVYLDVVAWPNKEGPSKNGETHYVVQELSREAREAGERGPIIGNLTLPEEEAPPPRQQQARPQQRPVQQAQQESVSDGMEDDDIPF